MKARTILDTLLRADVMLEHCGIVNVYEDMNYSDFIRQYFYYDFQDKVMDYYNLKVSEGEYFYCWFGDELDFGFGATFSSHYIDGQFLHICPLTDYESGEGN